MINTTIIRKAIPKERLKERKYIIGRFTFVTVTTPLGLEAVGGTRKSETDAYDQETAYGIARGRAMKALVKKLNKETINEVFMG